MGSANSKAEPPLAQIPRSVPQQDPIHPAVLPQQNEETKKEESNGCPMHRGDGSYSFDVRAVFRAGFPHLAGGTKPLTREQVESGSGCPVKTDRLTKGSRPEFNVYGQEINRDNNMPANPNQFPASLQKQPLSTERVASTIPKVRTYG